MNMGYTTHKVKLQHKESKGNYTPVFVRTASPLGRTTFLMWVAG
jgi:hypothetical protein